MTTENKEIYSDAFIRNKKDKELLASYAYLRHISQTSICALFTSFGNHKNTHEKVKLLECFPEVFETTYLLKNLFNTLKFSKKKS